MDVGYMFQHLVNSVYSIYLSFKITMGGVTVDLFQFLVYCALGGFLLKFVNDMHGGS